MHAQKTPIISIKSLQIKTKHLSRHHLTSSSCFVTTLVLYNHTRAQIKLTMNESRQYEYRNSSINSIYFLIAITLNLFILVSVVSSSSSSSSSLLSSKRVFVLSLKNHHHHHHHHHQQQQHQQHCFIPSSINTKNTKNKNNRLKIHKRNYYNKKEHNPLIQFTIREAKK